LFSEYRSIDCAGKADVGLILESDKQSDQAHWSLAIRALGSTRNSGISPEEFVLHAPESERRYGHTVRWKYTVELSRKAREYYA
jgi:hypothetical protein